MRKGFLIMLMVVLVAALAAPAMAGVDLNGFYRSKGYVSNFKNASATAPLLQKDAPGTAYVEQRLRAKFSVGEENVKAVWFSEIDFNWGDAAGSSKAAAADITGLGAARNSGGALGGDRINLETKNVYVWFKLPNTSLDFTVGLQNQSDAYAGVIFGAADMAGVFVKGKMEPVDYTLGWAKLYENATAKTDDMTLYIAAAKFSPTKDVKLGLNFYFLQDDTQKLSTFRAGDNSVSGFFDFAGQLPFDTHAANGSFRFTNINKKRLYIPGIDFAVNAGPATVSGFFIYEGGKVDFLDNTTDVNLKAFAFDLRADANIGPGKLFIEGIYVSGGDGSGNDYKSIVTLSDLNASPGGNSAFARTDMSILLVNADDINTSQALIGAASAAGNTTTSICATSPGNCGRGITHIAGGYTMKMADKITGKVGAGYLRATKLLLSDASNTHKGKTMGTEVNANVNYNIMKGLDFGLYGAYAWFGNFYTSSAGVDPDNAYDLHCRLNYAF